MSFVSIVGINSFISLMSDGRVSGIVNNEIITINENYRKFQIISDNNFIAYTGVKELVEEIVNDSRIENEKSIDWKIFGKKLKKTLRKGKYRRFNLFFAFGGKLSNRKFGFYTISTRDNRLIFKNCENDNEYKYVFLVSSNISDPLIIEKMFYDAAKVAVGNTRITKVRNIQEILNARISKIDNTVNNNTFYYLIQ